MPVSPALRSSDGASGPIDVGQSIGIGSGAYDSSAFGRRRRALLMYPMYPLFEPVFHIDSSASFGNRLEPSMPDWDGG